MKYVEAAVVPLGIAGMDAAMEVIDRHFRAKQTVVADTRPKTQKLATRRRIRVFFLAIRVPFTRNW